MAGNKSRRGSRRGSSDDGPRATLKQLVPFLMEHRRVLAMVAVLSVLGAAATLAQPLLVGQVISRVQQERPLGILVWVVAGLVVVSSLISAYQHYLLQRTGTSVVFSSRRRLIERILHLPISQFDARRTGDLVSRVGTDTTLLYAVLTQGLADLVGNALMFVGAIIAMAVIDPILLGLILLVLAASLGVVISLSNRIRQATAEQQEKVGDLSSGVERAIGSIRTVRAAGATDTEQASVTEQAQQAYLLGVRIAKVSALTVPVAGVALQVSLLVVLGVGGFRVASGAISIAELVMFIMFLFLLISPLGSFFGAVTSVNQALGALGRIQEILDLPQETDQDAVIAANVADAPVRGDQAAAIEFRRVHFRYPDLVVDARRSAEQQAKEVLDQANLHALDQLPEQRDEVLADVSFVVPRGARMALVGPSGAGKSTTLSLIERFYDPTDGAILLGGTDIRTIERGELRAQLGYVEQDAPTLAGTIADNLRLGSPNATDRECEEVLASVNLSDVVARSRLGINAPVGESGVMLSGGERQRLAIARALLAAHPILLLDESTSSLDGVNEQLMRQAIDAVATGRTLIVIAHRLSTVVDSDVIVVIDKGQVIGSGSHSELLDSTPLYRELAQHQLLV